MTKLRKLSIWKAVIEIVERVIVISIRSQNGQRSFEWKLDDVTVSSGVRFMQLTDGDVTLKLIAQATKNEERELISIWMEWTGAITRYRYDQFLKVPGQIPVHVIRGKRKKSNKNMPPVPGH